MSSRFAKNFEIEHLRVESISMVLVAHVSRISPLIWVMVVPLFRYIGIGVRVALFFCISGHAVSRSCFRLFRTSYPAWRFLGGGASLLAAAWLSSAALGLALGNLAAIYNHRLWALTSVKRLIVSG